ncbi:MAG: hypothetical protein JWM16_2697 [Verrucomicrobiales bacterium]|nr:hypothetical protein [Verrucomicrobiales bacterium]
MNEVELPNLPLRHTWNLQTGLALAGAGIWLMAAPFLLGYYRHGSATANDILVGILIAGIALATTIAPDRFRALRWLNSYLGFWLMAAPFVLGYLSYDFPKSGAVPTSNDLIVGGVVWFLSFIKAIYSARSARDFP